MDEEQGECSVQGTSQDATGNSGPSVASHHALCDSAHINSLLYFLLSEMGGWFRGVPRPLLSQGLRSISFHMWPKPHSLLPTLLLTPRPRAGLHGSVTL